MKTDKAMLTSRQRKFIAAIISGKSQAASAAQAGYAPGSARVQGHRLLQNDNVRKALADILTEKGLDDGYFADRLKELCEASGEKGAEWTARGRGLEILGRVQGHLDPKLKISAEEPARTGAEMIASLRASIAELLPHLQRDLETEKVIDITPKKGVHR